MSKFRVDMLLADPVTDRKAQLVVLADSIAEAFMSALFTAAPHVADGTTVLVQGFGRRCETCSEFHPVDDPDHDVLHGADEKPPSGRMTN